MPYYEVEVKFDDDTADVPTSERYSEVIKQLGAIETDNGETKTSTLFIRSNEELTREGLEKLFGKDIPILYFRRNA